MHGFKQETYCSTETLAAVEMDLLFKVMSEALRVGFKEEPKRGTLALYAQPRGSDAECVFIVTLTDGEAEFRCYDGKTTPSTYLADNALNGLLDWPEETTMYTHMPAKMSFGQLETDIYYGGGTHFGLVLNTTLGRFLAASYIDFGTETTRENVLLNATVLLVLRDVLVRLRPEDKVLRYLSQSMTSSFTDRKNELRGLAGKMMEDDELPETEAWKKWREKESKDGCMEVFFEKQFKCW